MAIDRIGKGAGLPATPSVSGAGAATKTGATFTLERPDPAASAAPAAGLDHVPAGASPLERFRSGEVDVNGYVDLEVDNATAGLDGLSAAELDAIKSVLRDQMKSDPGLVELVRTTTGSSPSLPEE
jgi:hypothetical protein